MKPAKKSRHILDQLRILLKVEWVEIPSRERKERSLAGIGLRVEEERRTEKRIFELAFARYLGFNRKTGKPGGKDLGYLSHTPQSDQRMYERGEFKDEARLYRTSKGGPLPNYILKAHVELLTENRGAMNGRHYSPRTSGVMPRRKSSKRIDIGAQA